MPAGQNHDKNLAARDALEVPRLRECRLDERLREHVPNVPHLLREVALDQTCEPSLLKQVSQGQESVSDHHG